MALENLAQLRAQLERCKVLLYDLGEDSCKTQDVREYVGSMISEIQSVITKTNKSIVVIKNENAIPVEPVTVTPAALLQNTNLDEKELTELQKKYEKREKQRSKINAERENQKTRKYHPDPKMNQVIKIHQEMGGVNLEKLIRPFSLEKPKIEMYDIYINLLMKYTNYGKRINYFQNRQYM